MQLDFHHGLLGERRTIFEDRRRGAKHLPGHGPTPPVTTYLSDRRGTV